MAVLLPLVINGRFGDMPAASPSEDGQFRVWQQSTGQFVPFDGLLFDPVTGDIFVLNLPTSDPGVDNQVWIDSNGFLKISGVGMVGLDFSQAGNSMYLGVI